MFGHSLSQVENDQRVRGGKTGEPWEVHGSRQAARKETFNMDSLFKMGGSAWKMREYTMMEKAIKCKCW